MADQSASYEHLLPRPRRVTVRPGVFREGDIRVDRVEPPKHRPHPEQWYGLRVRPEGIALRAAGDAGLRYGAATLAQLLSAGGGKVRAMDIEDWPDFPIRGVMLDISRDKVPTISTLHRLVDLLSGWKINQLQLYTEHTFAYAGHERVWRGASPMTPAQVEELDDYCRECGIELVPNQNSFGHLERWLKHEPYAALAEATGPWRTPWGEYRDWRTTLNPLDPGSIRLVESLYDQLLPHFHSRLFNVGCDETWELGQGRSAAACRRRGLGRVYLDFLLKIHRAVRSRGRRMMFWADIAQQHPELIAELPDDVIPMIWGYEADHPFDTECARVARRGLEFYVCPGTSSWCSFGGRTTNALANLRNAAVSGQRYGAAGYLITDWGDYGHRQYLPASLPGFLYGAAVSWCRETNAKLDVPRELSRHVFDDPTGVTGRLWCDAGTVHELSGVALKNRTILFAIMQTPLSDWGSIGKLINSQCRSAGPTEMGRRFTRMEQRINELQAKAAHTAFGGLCSPLAWNELLATLAVLRHAVRRGQVMLARHHGGDIRRACRDLAKDMGRLIARHQTLWLARNRRGGLASSTAHYRKNLREYLTARGAGGRSSRPG